MAGIDPPKKGHGRPKGAQNKSTQQLVDAIMHSFSSIGASKYLQQQAYENPVAYMGLLGKVLPKQVNIKGDSTAHHIHHDARQWLATQIQAAAQAQEAQVVEGTIIVEAKADDAPIPQNLTYITPNILKTAVTPENTRVPADTPPAIHDAADAVFVPAAGGLVTILSCNTADLPLDPVFIGIDPAAPDGDQDSPA